VGSHSEVFFVAQRQNAEGAADFDLFGNPALPLRDPRGRPAFKKSKENQLLVMTLAARGWSAEQIGPFMGAHPQTIRKYFSRELEHGALFLEGMAMQVLVNKALGGHAASVTKVLDMMEARVAPKSAKAKPEKPVPVGKKEALAAAAQKPTQGWGDLLN
jgi:hypothetical protein